MVSLHFRTGSVAAAVDPRPVHTMVGHINPRCTTCGRTPMQVAKAPLERCERMALPFDALWLAPAKAQLTPGATNPASTTTKARTR